MRRQEQGSERNQVSFSMSKELRIAACDIGSNALRLVVARLLGSPPHSLREEARYRIPVRLGDDVFTHGRVSDEKITLLVEACHAFSHLLRVFQPRAFRACATAALREAANGAAIVERVAMETGLHLEILTGAEEAQSVLLGATKPWLLKDKNYLFVDVGGGSTECTFLVDETVDRSASFRIGAVRLLSERVERMEWSRMRNWLEALPKGQREVEAIGTGGNILKIYDLTAGATGRKLTFDKLRKTVFLLEPLSIEERIREYGLKPDRADVIVEAGRVYQLVMEWAGIETMVVPKLGFADGLLTQLAEQITIGS